MVFLTRSSTSRLNRLSYSAPSRPIYILTTPSSPYTAFHRPPQLLKHHCDDSLQPLLSRLPSATTPVPPPTAVLVRRPSATSSSRSTPPSTSAPVTVRAARRSHDPLIDLAGPADTADRPPPPPPPGRLRAQSGPRRHIGEQLGGRLAPRHRDVTTAGSHGRRRAAGNRFRPPVRLRWQLANDRREPSQALPTARPARGITLLARGGTAEMARLSAAIQTQGETALWQQCPVLLYSIVQSRVQQASIT